MLKPDPNPTGSPYNTSFITDVVVKPGTHGQYVLAVLGWRNGSAYNGFYLSTSGGGAGSYNEITPTGDIDASDIGRTTLAYSADGSQAVRDRPVAGQGWPAATTVLQGIFVLGQTGERGRSVDQDRRRGLARPPRARRWRRLGLRRGHPGLVQPGRSRSTRTTRSTSTSAWRRCSSPPTAAPAGSRPARTGTTAWPANATCPPATHPDQHAHGAHRQRQDRHRQRRRRRTAGRLSGDAELRPLDRPQRHAAHPAVLRRARPASCRRRSAYWGGLQDNGTSLLVPTRPRTSSRPAATAAT